MAATEVEERARAQCRELRECVARINARAYDAIVPTRAVVSTMTFTAKLNVQRVCRDSMTIALSMIEGDTPLTSTTSRSERKVHKRKRPGSVFFNQITMRHGTKSVKVFDNGSMHVTGCTSPTQFLEVAEAVCKFMGELAGIETVDGSGVVRLTGYDTQMINLNFGVDTRLYLQQLCERYAAMGYVASYDSDTYPGLNVKLPVGDRRVTALLFKSGKVIITGAKTAEELESAHAMVTGVLDSAAHKTAKTAKNNFDA